MFFLTLPYLVTLLPRDLVALLDGLRDRHLVTRLPWDLLALLHRPLDLDLVTVLLRLAVLLVAVTRAEGVGGGALLLVGRLVLGGTLGLVGRGALRLVRCLVVGGAFRFVRVRALNRNELYTIEYNLIYSESKS